MLQAARPTAPDATQLQSGRSCAHALSPPPHSPPHPAAPHLTSPPRPPQRRQQLGLSDGDSDPALDDLSDEEWVPGEEPAELEEARRALAAYGAREGEEELPGGWLQGARAGRGEGCRGAGLQGGGCP